MSHLNDFQKELNTHQLEAYLITNSLNCNYLAAVGEAEGCLLILPEKSYFLTDFRYVEALEKMDLNVAIIDCEGAFREVVIEQLKDNGIKTLAFEGSLVYNQFEYYKTGLEASNIQFEKGPAICESLRMVKTEAEIGLIRKSAAINDAIFRHVVGKIQVGMHELDLKNELEYALRKEGATDSSFDLIVISGAKTSLPHGVASKKKIVYNEPILFDIGVRYNGYASDMTRMVYVGEPSKDFLAVYDIVKTSQQIGLDMTRPGVTGQVVDDGVRAYITEAGYGENFGHSTGHGVGLNIHERPNISMRSEDVLKKDMVFTIEPGIYLENRFGIRIEDLVVLGEKSLEVLSKTSKDLCII